MKFGDFLKEDQDGSVAVPRRTVVLMAWIFPILGSILFILGLMVGNLTAPDGGTDSTKPNCTVHLAVVGMDPSQKFVVLFLPAQRKGNSRSDPASIFPEQFQPIENEAITNIQNGGGALSRIPPDGRVTFELDADESYWRIVLGTVESRNDLERQKVAALTQYFLPVETIQRRVRRMDLVKLSGKVQNQNIDLN